MYVNSSQDLVKDVHITPYENFEIYDPQKSPKNYEIQQKSTKFDENLTKIMKISRKYV